MCSSLGLILFLGLVNISLQNDHVLFKKRIDAHDVSNDVSHDADDDADNDMAANIYHADSNASLEVADLNERKEKRINKDDEHAMRRLIEGFLGNKEVLYCKYNAAVEAFVIEKNDLSYVKMILVAVGHGRAVSKYSFTK